MAESAPQQQPPRDRPPAEQQAAAIAAALTSSGAVAGVTSTGALVPWVPSPAVLAALALLLRRWGYRQETVRWALRTAVRVAPAERGTLQTRRIAGPAERSTIKAERAFSSWFLQRSAERIDGRLDQGRTLEDATAPEQQYVDQHIAAQARRREAARRVDTEANKPGHVTTEEGPDEDGMGRRSRVILRWRAHPDDRTTPECRAADGAWFYADTPPIIGYPGMPHGGTCRCWATNAGSLAEVARGSSVNDAVRAMIGADPDHRDHPESGGAEERKTA